MEMTNIIAIHFDNSIFTYWEVKSYMLDLGIISFRIKESEYWFDVYVNKIKRLDNETRVKSNQDYTIIIEYEVFNIGF